MKENKTIVEMITRFTDIVNGLEVLGKTYKESEKGDEDIEVTPIKVAYKGHRNSRSKKLDQATYGRAHRVINDTRSIWKRNYKKVKTKRRRA